MVENIKDALGELQLRLAYELWPDIATCKGGREGGRAVVIKVLTISALEKLPVDVGLGSHCKHQSCFMSTPSARPFESMMGTLDVSYLAFSAILLLRGMPIARCGLCTK